MKSIHILPFPALMQGCKDCNKNVTNYKIIHYIFDVKYWLTKHRRTTKSLIPPHIPVLKKWSAHSDVVQEVASRFMGAKRQKGP